MLLVKQRRCRTEQKTHRGQAVGTRGCPQLTGGSYATPSCAGDGWAGSQLCPGSSPAAGTAAAPARHSLWLRGCRQCWGKWKLEMVPFPFPIPFSSLPFFPSLSFILLLYPPSFILYTPCSIFHPSPFLSFIHSVLSSLFLYPQSSSFILHLPLSLFILHPPFIFHPPSFSFFLHPPSLILLLHSPFSFIFHPSPSTLLPTFPAKPLHPPITTLGRSTRAGSSSPSVAWTQRHPAPLRHLAPSDAHPMPYLARHFSSAAQRSE